MSYESIGSTRSIKTLSDLEKNQMWRLFSRYYFGTEERIFLRDLAEKKVVFLEKDSETFEIVGFSTLKELSPRKAQKRIRIFFSGDTIVDENYWGTNSISQNCAEYIYKQKLKRPHYKIYWNLISKGYKTYLLLTNNFKNYYPSPFWETDNEAKKLIDACGVASFGEYYNPRSGCIEFPESTGASKDKLKDGVGEIDGEMLENPKINFFARANPHWKRGDELVCIGEMDLFFMGRFMLKQAKKVTQSSFNSLLRQMTFSKSYNYDKSRTRNRQ